MGPGHNGKPAIGKYNVHDHPKKEAIEEAVQAEGIAKGIDVMGKGKNDSSDRDHIGDPAVFLESGELDRDEACVLLLMLQALKKFEFARQESQPQKQIAPEDHFLIKTRPKSESDVEEKSSVVRREAVTGIKGPGDDDLRIDDAQEEVDNIGQKHDQQRAIDKAFHHHHPEIIPVA